MFANAVTRFAKNADLQQTAVSQAIIPTPNNTTLLTGEADLSVGINIKTEDLASEQLEAIKKRAQLLNLDTQGDYPVEIFVDQKAFDKDAVSGQYELSVTDKKTVIRAFDEAGAFYAMQSIFLLVSLDNHGIPALEIQDAPRYQYRGVMVEVARNFHSKEAMLATLEQMSAYKLNKLHLHLSDDEGWRIEIPGLPELTDIGSQRCFDETETTCLLPQLGSGANADNFGSGFFSKEDYMDFPYEVDPKERGYYWATRATDTRKMFAFSPENLPQNAETSVDRDGNGFVGKGTVETDNAFYGLSAQLWSETVRTDEQYEYMVFPGVSLQYSTDAGKIWNDYADANKPQVTGEVVIRSIAASGERVSRETLVK